MSTSSKKTQAKTTAAKTEAKTEAEATEAAPAEAPTKDAIAPTQGGSGLTQGGTEPEEQSGTDVQNPAESTGEDAGDVEVDKDPEGEADKIKPEETATTAPMRAVTSVTPGAMSPALTSPDFYALNPAAPRG